MNKTRKIKRTAVIVFIMFSILFFLQTMQRIIFLISRTGSFNYNLSPPLTTIFSFVLHLGIFVLCFLLFRTIIKNETPFKRKTVPLLKIIALTFICIDVQGAIVSIYRNFQFRNNPPPNYIVCDYAGIIVTANITLLWFGGFAIIAGLIIYLIALVLKYGISLQTQVDETL